MANFFRKKDADGNEYGPWRFQFVNWQGKRKTCTGYDPAIDGASRAFTETQKLAGALEREAKEVRRGYRPPPTSALRYRNRPFAEALAEYEAWGASEGGRGGRAWSKEHARKQKTIMAFWKGELGLDVLGDLDGILPDVEGALRTLKTRTVGDKVVTRTAKTLANYTNTLRGFCSWCVERHYLDDNPLNDKARIDTTPEAVRRPMTTDEIRRLLAVAPPERKLLYETALCSGLRANELRSLAVGDLDAEKGGFRLHSEWTKARKAGFQRLPAALVSRLAEAARGEPDEAKLLTVPTHAARTLKLDLAAAGIPEATFHGKLDFHALRTTFVNLVLHSGADAREAQALARHADPRMTMNTYGRSDGGREVVILEAVGAAVWGENQAPNADFLHTRKAAGAETLDLQGSYMKADGGSIPPASTISAQKTDDATPTGNVDSAPEATTPQELTQTEPVKHPTQAGSHRQDSAGSNDCRNADYLHTDSGLALVVDTWPTLPEPIKAAILAMIDSARGQ